MPGAAPTSSSRTATAPSLVTAPDNGTARQHEPASDLVCSARGCGGQAIWALRWNNSTLHTPERRKVWLACATHLDHLTQFLTVRGFLRETVAVTDVERAQPV